MIKLIHIKIMAARIVQAIWLKVCTFIRTTLVKDLERHYIIVCLSFPLHVGWGLPFTFLSVLGNIIFAPFLTLLLFGSIVYMACFFIGLPYHWTVWPLEKLISLWLWVLSTASSKTFVSCPCPSKTALYICCIIMGLSLHLHVTKKIRYLKIMLLSSILATFWCYAIIHIPSESLSIEDEKSSYSTYLTPENKVVLVCPKGHNHRRSLDTWIGYTLQQHIVYSYGRCAIDHIELDSLNKNNALLIRSLARHHIINSDISLKIRNKEQNDLLKSCAEATHCTIF